MSNSDSVSQLPISNLAFYRFYHVENPEKLRRTLQSITGRLGLKGTVLVASEGVNAMVAAPHEQANAFIKWLKKQKDLKDADIKISYSARVPFKKIVVKVKKEIVTMRVEGVDACHTAPTLPPETLRDWIRSDEPMILVDTRNDYECELGSFVGSIAPNTHSFNEFPNWVENNLDNLKDKKVVMFCTGGIRCEKASSWMLQQGLDNIFQLEGGILNYFREIPDAELDWKGDLFVFDDRVAIDTKSRETDATLCRTCGRAIKASSNIDHSKCKIEE